MKELEVYKGLIFVCAILFNKTLVVTVFGWMVLKVQRNKGVELISFTLFLFQNFDDMNLNQDGYDSSDKKSSDDEGKTWYPLLCGSCGSCTLLFKSVERIFQHTE